MEIFLGIVVKEFPKITAPPPPPSPPHTHTPTTTIEAIDPGKRQINNKKKKEEKNIPTSFTSVNMDQN